MTADEAIAFLQNHLEEMIATPEELAQWGDCICALHDYIKMLEEALSKRENQTQQK